MRPLRCLSATLTLAAVFAACGVAGGQGLPPSEAFTSIVHAPATETSFTFDRSMLAAADGFFGSQDPEARRVTAGLNSVTVHNYHYRDGADYDPGAFAALDGAGGASGTGEHAGAEPTGGEPADAEAPLAGRSPVDAAGRIDWVVAWKVRGDEMCDRGGGVPSKVTG